MEDKPEPFTRLSEKSFLSIQLVVVLIGGAVWITRLGTRVEQLDAESVELRSSVNRCFEKLQTHHDRLVELERGTHAQKRR